MLASVVAGQFEQASERACGVGVIVCEREAVALPALFGLPCLPIVLGRLRDHRQCSVAVLDRLRVVAELREHGREPVFCGRGERAAEAADAVGDRVHRLAIVDPLGAQHVVEHLARGRGEGCGVVRALAEPEGGQVCEERLVLGYPEERGRAGERHPAGRDQLRRLVGEAEQVDPVRDQALALADELRHFRRVAVLVGEAAVGARLLHGAEVCADHVLRDSERERCAVCLADLGGHLAQLCGLRRPVAALSGDDRVAAVAVVGERQRGDDPVTLHGVDQLGHPFVVEDGARVAVARADLGERDHAQAGGHESVPPSVRSASARSFSAAGSVARSKRASSWLRLAVARVGCVWST